MINVSKATRILTKDWQELVKAIPDDLETSAKEYHALRRRRGIKSSADLLRLILLHYPGLEVGWNGMDRSAGG